MDGLKQIVGDYFSRFGEYGENKFEIETRLSEFLCDVYKNNFNDNTIMIVSHGSITSYMKRILSIKSEYIKTGKVEEFLNVDFEPLFKYMKRLEEVKNERIKELHLIGRALIDLANKFGLVNYAPGWCTGYATTDYTISAVKKAVKDEITAIYNL